MPRLATYDLTMRMGILEPLVSALRRRRAACAARDRQCILYVLRTGCSGGRCHDLRVGHGLVVLPAVARGRGVGGGQHGAAGTGTDTPRARADASAGTWTASRRKPPKKGATRLRRGQKIRGRKRHLLVDTEGLLLKAHVIPQRHRGRGR